MIRRNRGFILQSDAKPIFCSPRVLMSELSKPILRSPRACAHQIKIRISVTLHKFYSTGSNIGDSNPKQTPVKTYADAGSLKKVILAENGGLSGVYR
jgi:hypothetical protein